MVKKLTVVVMTLEGTNCGMVVVMLLEASTSFDPVLEPKSFIFYKHYIYDHIKGLNGVGWSGFWGKQD